MTDFNLLIIRKFDFVLFWSCHRISACAATKVFELFEKQHVLDNVKEVSAYFEEKLDELVETIDVVVERRGNGPCRT